LTRNSVPALSVDWARAASGAPTVKPAASAHAMVPGMTCRLIAPPRSVQAQTKGRRQEYGHLLASDRSLRAIIPAAASAHHPPPRELLDPPAEGARGRHVAEHRRRTGRRVERGVQRAQH